MYTRIIIIYSILTIYIIKKKIKSSNTISYCLMFKFLGDFDYFHIPIIYEIVSQNI